MIHLPFPPYKEARLSAQAFSDGHSATVWVTIIGLRNTPCFYEIVRMRMKARELIFALW